MMPPQNMNKLKVNKYINNYISKLFLQFFKYREHKIQDIKHLYVKNLPQNKAVLMGINANLLMEHKN